MAGMHEGGASGAQASEGESRTSGPEKRGILTRARSSFLAWMVGEPVQAAGKTSDELAADRTAMAAARTLMAADRTLMAWLRTSLSMLSFGFTIYKVLQAFQQGGGILPKSDTPRNVGLFLAGMGTVAIIMGTIEYWQTLRELRQFREIRLARPPFVMALIMSVTGMTLFFSIIMRIF